MLQCTNCTKVRLTQQTTQAAMLQPHWFISGATHSKLSQSLNMGKANGTHPMQWRRDYLGKHRIINKMS